MGVLEADRKVFSKKTVKPVTDFDAKHLKGGGFRENTFSATAVSGRIPMATATFLVILHQASPLMHQGPSGGPLRLLRRLKFGRQHDISG